MNCDSADIDCACDTHEYLSFVDALGWATESGVEPYHLDGGCDPCVFFNSFRCIPLRGWVGEWIYSESHGMYNTPVKSKEGEEEIIRCENFRTILKGIT